MSVNFNPAIIFRIRSLAKIYFMGEIEVNALQNVNLDIIEGEFIVLLGPSGSGKTTLLNIIGGIDAPTSGDIYFLGKNIAKFNDRELTEYRRQNVGFVFQFYNLLSSLTAKENIEAIIEIANNHFNAIESLSFVNLEDKKNHFPSQLSGGEQQRVAIARAIAKKPPVLLCDEPTGALDIKTGIVVLNALKKLNEELHTTILIITHNAQIAMMADRVLHLQDGIIIKSESNLNKLSPSELSW